MVMMHVVNNSVGVLKVVMVVLAIAKLGLAAPTDVKRSAADDSGVMEYAEYQPGIQYDEYPVVVPKRAALLLDRMMVAIQKAIEEEEEAGRDNRISSMAGGGSAGSGDIRSMSNSLPSSEDTQMGLQRRGHGGSVGGQQHKGRVYWRCYFNAVTCFKRK